MIEEHIELRGGVIIKTTRIEQHQIKRNNPLWKTIDENCLYSKNLYNYANFIIRQEFIQNGRWIRYNELDKMLHHTDPYLQLMSQPSQQTLATLDKVWKSFFAGIKEWKKNPSKYLGMPKLPKYKDKNGRFPWFIKNNSCRIEDGKLKFTIKRLSRVTFPTKAQGRLIAVRFIPNGSCYTMEIITEVEIPDFEEKPIKNIIGIDLGVDNLATISNNIGLNPIIVNGRKIKSINQFYNKQKAKLQSDLKLRNDKNTSRRLQDLTLKRNNRIKTAFHTASRMIVNYCVENNIDTVVCGLNKNWKQESKMSKVVNQKFIYIPYNMLINQLEYKLQECGVRFIINEEAYTSGTSFLDNEQPIKEMYNKGRRVKRGLFQASKTLINADINAAYQIIKKVSPNSFGYGVEGCSLNPTIINIA